MLIDFHQHCHKPSDIDVLVEIMSAVGYESIVVAALPAIDERRVAQNDLMFACKKRLPGRVYGFAALDHTTPQAHDGGEHFAEQARQLIARGADGFNDGAMGLSLKADTVEKICAGNAKRILGGKPRLVDLSTV